MKDKRINVAKRCGRQTHSQGFHEPIDLGFISSVYFKGKHAAVSLIFKQTLRQCVLRVVRKSGIVDFPYSRMFREPFSNSLGVLTLLFDSQGQGFQASQSQPRFERTQHAADQFVQLEKFSFIRLGGRNYTRQHIPMARKVFRGAMDDEVRAVLERIDQIRGSKGIIHQQRRAMTMRKSRKDRDIGYF